jgi:hypothetical protein
VTEGHADARPRRNLEELRRRAIVIVCSRGPRLPRCSLTRRRCPSGTPAGRNLRARRGAAVQPALGRWTDGRTDACVRPRRLVRPRVVSGAGTDLPSGRNTSLRGRAEWEERCAARSWGESYSADVPWGAGGARACCCRGTLSTLTTQPRSTVRATAADGLRKSAGNVSLPPRGQSCRASVVRCRQQGPIRRGDATCPELRYQWPLLSNAKLR